MGKSDSLVNKYRLKNLNELFGQENVKAQLKGLFRSEPLTLRSHLLIGPHGTGKTSVARMLARAVNCENLDSVVGPCGECKSCQNLRVAESVDGNVFMPDVFDISCVDYSGVNDIKYLLYQIRFSSACRYRVFILDEVHMLTVEAQSSLLRKLEEPPENVVFCLCTTKPDKLLPTIISRCYKMVFENFTTETCKMILARIAEGEGLSGDTIEYLARNFSMDARAAIMELEGALNDAK